MNDLFPLRMVTGERFCNRIRERKLLKDCIKQKRPTALISPRRYGKTSLANQITEDIKYPFCSIDLLTAYDNDSICKSIIQGISGLISQIMPINMKTIKMVEKYFYGIRAAIRYKCIELEFALPIEKYDPVYQVLETLRGLEKLAAKLDKTVIVFIDEFQRIMEVSKGDAIQGAIRSVAQAAQNIAFLFSGSSRHMLSKMFDDPNLPLYMMCEKLFLGRISEEDYIPYIQLAAEIKWSDQLDKEVVKRILELTETHPFYINYLCSILWRKDEKPTDMSSVDNAWQECLKGEERRLVEELDMLTLNQRLLLKEIARSSRVRKLTGSDFLNKVKLSSGTVVPILRSLRRRDMIYTDDEEMTRVLDPLMKYFLSS